VRAVRVPAEPWRATRGEGWSRRLEAGLRSVALAPWLALLRWRLRRAGVRYNTDVRGLTQTGQMDEATVVRLIETLDRDGTEIFFHPATESPSPAPLPQSVAAHVAELDALRSPRVRSALAARGAVPAGFGDLG
ncbi:MAG: ChbG/HpnK family deacetylase, partial [Acidimicrobiales bacterium]